MKRDKNSLLKAIGLTSKLLIAHTNEKLMSQGFELTHHQFVLLKILRDKEGICQNDLAFLTERDKTSLTRLINSLETKELVKRIADKTDKRKNMIYLTEEGKNTLDMAWPLMAEIEYDLISDLNPVEVQTTLNILKSIQAKVIMTESVIV